MTLLFFKILILLLNLSPRQKSQVTVEVNALRNDRGSVGIVLHVSPEAFPSDASKSVAKAFVPISKRTATHTFSNLSSGVYAVSVFHDEDNDKNLKTGMFGIPKEGWGTSNDAKGLLGPPKFSDASFEVKDSSNKMVKITINY